MSVYITSTLVYTYAYYTNHVYVCTHVRVHTYTRACA